MLMASIRLGLSIYDLSAASNRGGNFVFTFEEANMTECFNFSQRSAAD